ncbi:hypothetical protein HPB48_011362 [Haemaphysalis longicornis]|uniref:THAP-type domain-containing protein n=1 Tax=Haemaphysalis longicornis TaxID=44386 RepID=A0A9J6FWR5_HAELO|nr:hypothetical protein HPB48_011362 [Haemaphysalis longicornis]
MPLTCCVPGCISGYRSRKEKGSLFLPPKQPRKRDRWKGAIHRQEMDAFSFESKAVRECEKHFDPTDIIRADEFKIRGQSVLLQREKPAEPRIFENLPAYLTKPKPRSRPNGKIRLQNVVAFRRRTTMRLQLL